MAEYLNVTAPPSKSLSHRYVICASLANGTSIIKNTLKSDDLTRTKIILEQIGAKITETLQNNNPNSETAHLSITGISGKIQNDNDKAIECNVHESGTTCRLITAILASGIGKFRIYGSGRMPERPIKELTDALEGLGTKITFEGNIGCPPILLESHGLNPKSDNYSVHIGMDTSSQFFSGLLLASPMATKPISIELTGNKAVSWPYVALTLQCMQEFGINFNVEYKNDISEKWIETNQWQTLRIAKPGCLKITVKQGIYKSGNYNIEGDWSGASYFLAAGALGQRPIKINNLKLSSLQGDRQMLTILENMGAKIKSTNDSVIVYPSNLHSITVDMGDCPDLVPTVAMLAAFATGTTTITNIAHLKAKESDRIKAPAEELAKIGIKIEDTQNSMSIIGNPNITSIQSNQFSAHNDHRIAMSLALTDLRIKNCNIQKLIDQPNVVNKSFPNFWEIWNEIR